MRTREKVARARAKLGAPPPSAFVRGFQDEHLTQAQAKNYAATLPGHDAVLYLDGWYAAHPRKNPAKLERCVRDVKKHGVVRNAWAVCKASLAGTTQHRKRRGRNPAGYWVRDEVEDFEQQFTPVAYYIHIQHGRGPVMLWNGQTFSNDKAPAPHPFASESAAVHKATRLLSQYPMLDKYRMYVARRKYGEPLRRVNPAARGALADKLDAAAQKLQNFTGHEATHVERAPSRSTEKTGLVIGELDLIGYRAKRDGKVERYGHQFRKRSRPLLAVSTDGKQLHVVGGRYEFTEAGIEDR